ncbi:MarR family winged helix-turn-helix transcriptional regulator [Mucilaginibacter aquatilis]|uniref:MarR family transcriptional regulator n=1 Tax=Mucilaginibacter aquatilis TaxID=1517760 RepID=A0A6I4IP90_9SPHI|nr:hypothetical protein [Mucilaginibacter aquatilis]MVN89553.1 hypothetical protein [Mucilaginibacter aquatilis]
MPYKTGEQKPIGWYLRKADQRITDFFEEVFDRHCITRYHWMLLSAIADKETINVKIFQPDNKYFFTPERLNGVAENLVTRGWIKAVEKDEYALTDNGKKLYNALEADYMMSLRQMMLGVTDDEYNQVVKVLDRIITNLAKK